MGGLRHPREEVLSGFLALSRFGGGALEGGFLDPDGKRCFGWFHHLQAGGLTSRTLAALTLQYEGGPALAPLGSVFEPTRLLWDSTTCRDGHFYRGCGLGYGRERNMIRLRHRRGWGKELRCSAFPELQRAQSAAWYSPGGTLRHPAITKAQWR